MAFETEQGNITRQDAVISSIAAPRFVEVAKALAHCAIQNFNNEVDVIRFRQKGKFEAEIVGESAAYAFDADDEVQETEVDITAQNYVQIYKPTVQQEEFTANRFTPSEAAMFQGEAIARKIDGTWLPLFTGFTNGLATQPLMNKDALLDSQFTVHDALQLDDRLHVVMRRKDRNEIRKEITSITADAFGNEFMLQTVMRRPNPQGLVGEFVDMLIFNTSGLPVVGADTVSLAFHPDYAFACGIRSTIFTRSVFKASEGLFTEVASWMFANIGEWIDDAGCRIPTTT